MSGGEIVVIVLVFLLLFGSKAIPDVAKVFGKAMREFQKATDDIKREINESGGGIGDDIGDIKSTIQNARNSIQEGIKKHTGDITSDIQEIKNGITKGAESVTKPIHDEVNSDFNI
ncbi:MAG TPA: twin-arginine translocase TatA/TatE family subunit [Prolixibacteraceae bacterium]